MSTPAATRSSLRAGLSIGAAWLVAAVVAAFGIHYILATTNPVVMSDGWYFVDAWLIPWQDGSFGLADLWAKRHGNHAQPFAALLFLANAHWLGLDMAAETVVAIAFAATFCVLLDRVARRDAHALPRTTRAWFLAAIVCIVFSINANDKIAWSIVGLFYLGHCLGLLFLCVVANQREALQPVALFAAALGLCVAIDTTGLLWCAASIACLVATLPRATPTERRRHLASIGLVALALAVYLPAYRWLAPPADGPEMPPIASALSSLAAQAGESWKALLPFGAAYARSERLALLLGDGPARVATFALVALGVVCHVWMWRQAFVARANRGVFLACGLALYAYGTIAGILLQRVPLQGWDYLLQPRYGVFYDFLVLAPMLAWACRPSPAQASDRRARLVGPAVFLLLPCVLALGWMRIGRIETPWIQAYNEDIARDTWALVLDPETLPEDCNPFVSICGWDLATRRRLVAALADHELNLASRTFRERHDLDL